MKILSCYIAGFGKFVGRKFDFTSDLVVVKQNNGWGKTTLADFIRCMLYGLDGGRVRSVGANDRAHYEPWTGGAFGGTLTFAFSGKTYRVERSFGKTPAHDLARVYDENNMLCYDFGDRAERLGETLLGVNAESYRKSVYIPQGEIDTGGLPDDAKTRLLSLLSGGGNGENGALAAIERLDAADRALRARRRPAKGKLDELDERLENIAREKAGCDERLAAAEELRRSLAQTERDIEACAARIRELSASLEAASRRNEYAARRQTATEVQARLTSAQAELEGLKAFFGSTDPATVNVEGLQAAVAEYYELKPRTEALKAELAETEGAFREKQSVRTQIEDCKKILLSSGVALEDGSPSGGGARRRVEKGRKIIPPSRKSTKWILFLSLFAALLGAIFIGSNLLFGGIALAVGCLGLVAMFFRTLPRRERIVVETREPVRSDLTDETQLRLRELEARLSEYPPELEERRSKLSAELESANGRAAALETGIVNFLRNFRFSELYDYRAAIGILREKIAAHKKALDELGDCSARIAEYAPPAPSENEPFGAGNEEELKARKAGYERRKEELCDFRARALTQAEELERRSDKESLLNEEARLTEEKVRLENRRRAILEAKRFLLRAQENTASRYLEPVARGCRYYAELLWGGEQSSKLRFSSEGAPLLEENGALRELGYYSLGSKALIGLCTRFALVDAIYRKERPVLVLDDPFVDLDDEKTERAKLLVKELSKRYQIVYLTCKTERKP